MKTVHFDSSAWTASRISRPVSTSTRRTPAGVASARRAADEHHLGAAPRRLGRDRVAHLPGGAVREHAHRIERFARAAGRHHHDFARERRRAEPALGLGGDLRRLGHAALAFPAARERAALGTDEAHAALDMVQFCIEQDFTLRLIETMPMGDTGRSASDHYMSLEDVRRRLAERFELVPTVMPGGGPARYVSVAGTNLRIGFITPISQHFCAGCNRVRLSADGALYLCLGQEDKVELRPLLRQGIGDEELKNAIRAAIARKPEKHDFREQPQKIVRFMSMTGG